MLSLSGRTVMRNLDAAIDDSLKTLNEGT